MLLGVSVNGKYSYFVSYKSFVMFLIAIGWEATIRRMTHVIICIPKYWGADMSLAQPGRKRARKHVRDTRDFNNIETQAVVKFFSCEARH